MALDNSDRVPPRLLLLLAFGQLAGGCNERGATSVAFGASRSATPQRKAYFEGARKALDQYLVGRGFATTSAPAAEAYAPVYGLRVTWYRGSLKKNSSAFLVQVRHPIGRETGLAAYVRWHGKGTRAKLSKLENEATAFRKQLTRWWRAYLAKRPEPHARQKGH